MTASVLRRRPQLSEEVAARLRAQIMSGVLGPGTFVRIDDTAADLGVSATPVREALVTLRGEGLVEQVPNRGYRVGELSREDIDDIFWLQGTIASKLARRAARVITDVQIEGLVGLNARLRDAVARADAQAVETCEFEFHRFINRVAGGKKLAWFLFGAIRYTPARLYASDPSWGEQSVRSHDALIAAFSRCDFDTVSELMRRQFADGAERLVAHLGLP
ncbi:GntR family transcriptional regulator [Rhodococcoides fascians]|uniref:GntR family transcriptional regulator n=1 Tax=Rhodococcoides fascians TaxID=1828 RepID=UPI00055D7A55|nr:MULTISPECIES: GntR family transcriptional regulator [Rhodococcus]OZC46738.1 GntR family transcriptional regulator [Rhodococcus sp. 06-621-2]OZC77422.1 GntR family transcriptional regulator [Rhodococcus sp. 06-418-1B]OZC77766.1 GntR family transcriptional regulator [Rhodococcus sp. 06-418-1B]